MEILIDTNIRSNSSNPESQKRRAEMTVKHFVKVPGVVSAFVVILLAGMFVSSTRVRAQHNEDEDNDRTASKIRIGFQIAPVTLNLAGKNRALVGLGSYIVNAQADCNGCHSAGPATEFAQSGNPYFGQPKIINPATYLG